MILPIIYLYNTWIQYKFNHWSWDHYTSYFNQTIQRKLLFPDSNQATPYWRAWSWRRVPCKHDNHIGIHGRLPCDFYKKRCTQISIQTSWYASAEGAPPFWECVLYSARWPGPDSFDNVDISGKHCSSSYRKVVSPFPSFVEEIIQINFSCSFIKFFRIPVFFL